MPCVKQNLACAGSNAEPGQCQCEMLAQRQIAERMSVFEQIGPILAC